MAAGSNNTAAAAVAPPSDEPVAQEVAPVKDEASDSDDSDEVSGGKEGSGSEGGMTGWQVRGI